MVCNLVSLRKLHQMNLWWDNQLGQNVIRTKEGNPIAYLEDRHDQFVIEYQPEGYASFTTTRPSYRIRNSVLADAQRWHLRLGHPGPQAIEHLVNASKGARIRGPTTVECDACGIAKMKRQIRRTPKDIEEGPGLQLAIDFHDFEKGYQDFRSLMLVTDRWSGLVWDYYLQDRTSDTIIKALEDLFRTLKHQYNIIPKIIECDNEIVTQKPQVYAFICSKGIKFEPSAPNTQSQNGGAERSGGVIKDKARAMREGAKLPAFLWPEIVRAAVYLFNRTPHYQANWKTPIDRFHTYIAHSEGVVVEDRKPQQAHLKVYGCKAFAMTPEAQKKEKRLQRFKPRAWIGYLVGYDSTNIYRIWLPRQNRVIRTRDVIFNEEEQFSGNMATTLAIMQDEFQKVSLQEFNQIVENIEIQHQDSLERGTQETDDFSYIGHFDSIEYIMDTAPSACDLAHQQEKEDDAYPTPPESPKESFHPAALFSSAIGEHVNTQVPISEHLQTWKASFLAGRLIQSIRKHGDQIISKAKLERLIKQPGGLSRVHRRNLPPEPKCHRGLKDHPLGTLFEQAEKVHLKGHKEMQTWQEIMSSDPLCKDRQILDCKWIYVYKFDKHGRFLKCKARLVVRGDQQKNHTDDLYAATLAVRSFRVLMSIAARFDLELIQYDITNAFVNAEVEEDVFMRMPPGYRRPGRVLKLKKALFGLKQSPVLWQRLFKRSLQDIGFHPIPHEPCCMAKGDILIFFYVDDIVLAYRKKSTEIVQQLVKKLQDQFKMTGGTELQWFLGIEIIRDRKDHLIWLSQSSYIEKIANLSESQPSDNVPMAQGGLHPYTGTASLRSIHKYQRKIGSLMYAAVVTRPDIAFATSKLSQYLMNPSPEHHKAADQVLRYLQRTQDLALQLGGGDDYILFSDASFADNQDRKSSQGYIIRLFGGTVGWRANKQATVTTSTTEAELLALSQASREGMFMERLLNDLQICLDNHHIHIFCDNVQTIRLVNEDINRLQTRLRHVDIHNHWLRQEARMGRIRVEHCPTSKMLADGLTKALPRQKFEPFVEQLGLVDVSKWRHENKNDERHQEIDEIDEDIYEA
ncbi:hypothetical protein CNMCM5793_006309 [Aspergillus hiratsukae]|uniref:Integrase catalytic domain-containing protein n=1 Tax=Aspergillus hiratsukae TaxID=1194566 RepID=A0A8H6PHQ7_9EURO|nr:hypothetical protein CNMCM5793_006309 [Aspergillus hiratsukae]